MKKWIALFVSFLFVLVAINPFTALAAEKGKYAGKVSEINLEAKSFKLITADKTWSVKWTEKTDFIFEGKKTIPDQLKDDVQVLVIGVVQEDGATLEAAIVAWGEAPGKDPGKDPGKGRNQPPMVFGKINVLNLTDKTFNLQAKDPQGNEVVFKVTYRAETKFIRDKKIAKPEDFKESEEVTVAGKIDKENKTIEALIVVLGKVEPPKNPGQGPGEDRQPPMVFGVISRFNLDNKVFHLTTKDQQGKEVIFEVHYTQETKFIKDKKQVTPNDFKIGDEVTVAGKIDLNTKNIIAVLVIMGKLEQPGNPQKPEIKWDRENIIREEYSVFSDETIDINFKSTLNKEIAFKVTVSDPWLILKSENGKVSDQKITVKVLGEKLVAWKTNAGFIKVSFPNNPEMDKKILVSVYAIGNIVIVKIGSNVAIKNEKPLTLDAGSIPILKNGRTFVGILFMGEIVFNNKAKISFDSKTQTVYFQLGLKKIELYIGKPYAIVNGNKVKLDAPPFIQNGRTFVPLRFVSENLDAAIGYDAKTQTITIVYPGIGS